MHDVSPTWRFGDHNPILAPGLNHDGLVTTFAGAGHVVRKGDGYQMIYWAKDAQGGNHIVRAVASIDQPDVWHADGGPLLSPQPGTEHNHFGPGFPFLLPVDDRRVLLYFCGWGKPRAGGKLPNTTGVAISDDGGRTFRYHDQHPVLPLDRDYDQTGTGSVWVEREGRLLRMWYTAIGAYFNRPEGVKTGHGDVIPRIGIAYAESDDGLTWRKPVDDLVIKPRGFDVEPYEYICSKPAMVRHDDGTYTMWVNTFGTAYRVHRLTSGDGIRWTWSPRVGPDGELGVGRAGTFDDVQRSYPCILRHGNELRCWYTGNGFGRTGIGYAVAAVEGGEVSSSQ